jgi:sugar/nucleoside kinase (ribokinase family)
MSTEVVALGAHVLDILGRPVTDIPQGQGSIILDEIRLAPAGSAAGTAVGIAKLGATVASVGAIGDDALGEQLVHALDAYVVDTAGIVTKRGVQTSASILPIRPNGDRPALHAIGANPLFTIDDVPWPMIDSARHLHLGGPDVMRGLGRDGAREILKRARQHSATTTVDLLGGGSPRMLAILKPALEFVDWMLPNVEQACALTQETDAQAAASKLLDCGVTGVVLTMGGEGSLMVTARERIHLPAYEVEVSDTSGCGDAYCAGFIRAMLMGWPPSESIRLGNAAAALVATGLGSDAGIRGLDDTLRFMRETPLRARK